MNTDRWYVYILIADDTALPYYVGKGTGQRIFNSLGEKYFRLLEEGWPIGGPHNYRAYFLFTDIYEEDVAFGLEAYVIYSFDEDQMPLLNRQRRNFSPYQGGLVVEAEYITRQDYITFHPVPITLPERLRIVMGLDQHHTITPLDFTARWTEALFLLGNGKLPDKTL